MKRLRIIALTAFVALLPLLCLNAAPEFSINGSTLTAVELNGDSEIIIPDGVTVIMDYAFRNCYNLTSLIIPASVMGIGGAAFYGCSNLSHITFMGDKLSLGSENLGYIAQNCVIESNGHYNGTYYDSSSNVRWTINDGHLTHVELNGETKITIPSVVTSIGNALQGRLELKRVTIPASVTTIVNAAFDGCRNLESIEFKGNAPACNSLFYHDVPDSCEVVVSRASTGWGVGEGELWRGLVLRYASNVEWIINDFGDLLNVNLNGENDIRVPNGVARIMPHAFGGCNELTSVIIPNSVIVIENAAFADCLNLTNVTIGTGVERIEDGAFSRCSHLTRVMIPDSVTYIGNGAFDDCEALTTFHVGEGNLAYKVVSGMLLTRDGTTLVAVPGGLTEASIPNSVTSIRDCAFSGCRKLTSLTIPDKVTRIGAAAFSGCSNLTNAVIPASVTHIGDKAFAGCSGLADEDGFVIVRNVLYAYSGIGGDIVIPDSVTTIGGNAFCNCRSMTSITMPGAIESIGEYAFCFCSALMRVSMSDSLKSIGDYAFRDCYGLTNVAIPDSVVHIGKLAFVNCGGLREINIGTGVKSVGESAFFGCSQLASVTIPNTVTSIGNSAFSDCSCLSLALLPSRLSGNVSANNQFRSCASDLRIVFYEGNANDIEWLAVSLDANGGMIDTLSMDVLRGQSIDAVGGLPSPSRPHCRFLGWFTDAYGGEPVTAETILNENVTLYAHWELPTTIPIADGGSLTIADGVLLNAHLYGATKVTIPDFVTSIADNAFAQCLELTNLTIPDSVTSIGYNAFYRCSGLSSVTIPQYVCANGMSTVFPSAYQSITNVIISDGVTNIEQFAFGGCNGLTSVIIPKSVTSIGDWAFYGCSNLSLVFIPSRLSGSVSRDNQFIRCASDLQIVFYEDSDWITVNLDANGGELDSLFVNTIKGLPIGNLPVPLRPNYEFLGWFTDAEGGEQVTAETTFNWNATLYVHWEKLPVYLWVYAMVKSDSRDTVTMLDGDVASSSMAFPVPQKAEGSFVTNIVFQVKDGYEIDTITTNGAVVAEASGKKGVWTLNIDLQDCNSHSFVVDASARLENYGVVAEKATCERTTSGYTLTAKVGETLSKGDIALTALLDGAVVDTTKGYDVKIAADGKSATAQLKTPTFGVAAIVVGEDPPATDSSDPTGTLVESDGVVLSTQPWANDDEQIGALPVAAVPGLYYQAAWGDSLDNLTTGIKVQATTDTLYLGVIKQIGTSGFYKVTVSEQ